VPEAVSRDLGDRTFKLKSWKPKQSPQKDLR
jgi:hypothetical protein